MIVSIDIGTVNSSISMLSPEGKAQPIDISTGVSMFGSKYSLPSAVFVDENSNVEIGQAALNSRARLPQNFRNEFKRNLGETFPICLGDMSFLPEELYTLFFRHMKACAEKVGGEVIETAYVTVPATYGKRKRDKVSAAAKAAGLFQLELVPEPTAAAMSYCASGYVKDGQTVLVYDFGGGTFDVAIIRYEDGDFKVLGEPMGLENCGGMDIDRMIYRDIYKNVDQETLAMIKKNPLHTMRFDCLVSESAVKIKHQLSTTNTAIENIPVGFDVLSYQLKVEQLNQMISGMVGETIRTCREMLDGAGLNVSNLSSVLLVGGTSRIPLVQEMVQRFAGETIPVYCAPDLELAVAQGALNYSLVKKNENPEEWYQAGLDAMKNGEWDIVARWCKKAAEVGHMKALVMYGGCLECGLGVERDELAAMKCYKEAADNNEPDGMYELGRCYEYAIGVSQNKQEAMAWYQKAADQGNKNAQDRLQKIEAAEQEKEVAEKCKEESATTISNRPSQNPVFIETLCVRALKKLCKENYPKENCPWMEYGDPLWKTSRSDKVRKNLSISSTETLYYIFDNTFWGSVKSGFALTNKGMYVGANGTRTFYAWSKVLELPISLNGSTLCVNNVFFSKAGIEEKEFANKILNNLQNIVKAEMNT